MVEDKKGKEREENKLDWMRTFLRFMGFFCLEIKLGWREMKEARCTRYGLKQRSRMCG